MKHVRDIDSALDISLPKLMNPSYRLSLCAGLIAGFFIPQNFAVAVPATVSLGAVVQTYDGSPKIPTVVTSPPGLSVSWKFVPAASLPPPATVFANTPLPLANSYASVGFAAQLTWALGDRVQLAGTARNLISVDAVMVTWAKAAIYPVQAAANPAGWHHPIKLTVYDMNAAGVLTHYGEVTQQIFVPWRPLTLPNGQPYPVNGFAFLAHFDFPAGLVMPERPVFSVTYNTANSGFAPIGSPGPYNDLNVAVSGSPIIGSDVDPAGILWVRSATSWVYPAEGTAAPMFIVKASNSPPPPGTATPPVNAGTWQATATITTPGYEGQGLASFTILPAPAQILLGNLTQIADGAPKPVSTTTYPPGIGVNVTYNGSATAPSGLGKYAVHAAISNPNYQGTASGELWLGQNLASWLAPWILGGTIDPSLTGGLDDPDHDSLSNLLEYAGGLDPSSAANFSLPSGGSPRVEYSGNALSLIYRKNLNATDLVFQVETTIAPGGAASWVPATTVDTILETVGSAQTIRATLPAVPAEARRFVRLGVRR